MQNSLGNLFKTEQSYLFVLLLRWLLIASCAGVLAGSASALLLFSLNLATEVRESHPRLIALLPVAGLFVGCLYKYFGSSVEAGNNLILDEVHDPQATIPLRMTPLVLIGTFLTHLFGGSAGREGTAIQTGASLADQLTRLLRLSAEDRRILLMAGISGGFGSVSDAPPRNLPQCLELVGEEESLQLFLQQNRERMGSMRVMFLRGEEARIEADLDRQEIEEALQMERERTG